MIISKKPITLAEVKEYVADLEENKNINYYLKAFSKLSVEKATKCIDEIHSLNNHKLNDEKIVKIVDFLPEDMADINKLFIDISLSEEEATSILNIIKKYL